MHCQDIPRHVYQRLCDYNLFIPDADWYEDETYEPIDTITQTKLQKYATWLYVFLFTSKFLFSKLTNNITCLLGCFYNLFIGTLMAPQTRTITVTNITQPVFNQLLQDHSQTLSCRCTTTSISYHTFVTTSARFHPLCSSDFISRSWIEALYLDQRSIFFVADFRTTAFAQVS